MILVVPIAVAFFYRLGLAFVALYHLLSDAKLLRALPWHYIVRLPRANIWVAIATASLVVGVVGMVGAALLPGPYDRDVWGLAFVAVVVGILSSWTRVVARWLGLRPR